MTLLILWVLSDGILVLWACLKARKRLRILKASPVPPEDVRLVYPDGTEVPVECRYDGVVDGLHHWSAVTPGVWIPGMLLKMEMLPGRRYR